MKYEKQGLTNHTLYSTWYSMKSRCYNKKVQSFKSYGGRGIIMCDEWLNNFFPFYKWAKDNGWKEGLQIDRIDVNGNYEPNNCQFITQKENLAVGKRRKYTDNKSGYTGIHLHKSANKWVSNISYNNKQIYLGLYLTKEEALQARIDAEIKYFGEQKTNLNL